MARDRRAVPANVQREVLAEAGHMCANPRCRALILELHHIAWVKDGGGNEASNLLALCPNCHALHTRGDIPRSTIELWKLMLMRLNDALDRDSLDLLLFMYHFQGPLAVTGDGLLRLARLMNTGLVHMGALTHVGDGALTTWMPELTDFGMRLVVAWTDGDAGTVRELLVGSA
jgi:HNH endonuclease